MSRMWIVALGLTSGCAIMGQYSTKARLMKAVEGRLESLRWGGSRGLEAVGAGRRISSVHVRHVKFNEDKDKATLVVEMEGFRVPQMVVIRWHIQQTWKENADGWYLVKEKELKPSKGKSASSGRRAKVAVRDLSLR